MYISLALAADEHPWEVSNHEAGVGGVFSQKKIQGVGRELRFVRINPAAHS